MPYKVSYFDNGTRRVTQKTYKTRKSANKKADSLNFDTKGKADARTIPI